MPIDRREFLAGLSGLGVGLGLGWISHLLPLPSPGIGPDWTPGHEEFVASTCLLCPSHCGIRGRVVDGRLVRIDGNPLHPVSQGGLCAKGRAGIQLLYHPGRIVGPLERIGPPGSDQFRRLSWEDALSRIAGTLGELRSAGEAGSVAWLTGDLPGIMGELVRRFASVYGTPHVIREDYADGSSAVMKLCQSIDAPPAFDLAASDFVLSFGAALSEAWWSLPQAARARAAAGSGRPRWVQVDVRHSRTAARADEWLAVRPGTYGTLALGLAYVILKEGLFDTERVRDEVLGIDDLQSETGEVIPGFRTLVLRYGRTRQVSERTGVPAEALVRLAKAFGAARRPVAVWDQSVSWRSDGLSDALAIHALNILVGALNRPGGVLVQPRLPVPPLAEAAGLDVAGALSALTPGDWAARIATETPSPVKAMFLYQANPLASSPDPAKVEEALERLPLLVSFSPFLDESSKHAHFVLPDHTYLERWQDAPAPPSVPTPVWGLVQPMVRPLHDTRASGDVILDLASRLGGDVARGLPWSKVEDLVEERGKALAAAQRGGAMAGSLRREELRELESRGWWLPHGKSRAEFWEAMGSNGGWFDPYYDYDDRSTASQFPDGKVWLFSLEARRLLRSTTNGLAEGFLPTRDDRPVNEDETAYPLQLIPYRVMTLASGGTALMPWLLEHLGILTGDAWESWAEINPETGRRLGLTSGQVVRIESEAGAFRARLRFFAGAQPDVVNAPYGLHTAVEGWGRADGANPLRAIGDRRDLSTGLPDWLSTRVRVVPA
jgi:anaerobic selenocysteine-containing dehydrogenase